MKKGTENRPVKSFLLNFIYTTIEKVLAPIVKWILQGKIYSMVQKLDHWWTYSLWKARLGTLGRSSVIHPHVVIHAPENVHVGCNVAIGEFVLIWGGGGVYIGDDVLIASHVVITSQAHDVDAQDLFRNSLIEKPIIIENNVWIGAGAIILPGIRIQQGSIVGAGSVVTHDVPTRVCVVGIPAREIRKLSDTL